MLNSAEVRPEVSRGLDIHQIMAILPQRYPMLMIDRIENLEPGVAATAIKCVTANEPHFVGHFPGRPVMPGVLIVEAMAQASGIMLRTEPVLHAVPAEGEEAAPSQNGRLGYIASVQKVRFRKQVVPGDMLRIEVRNSKSFGTLHQVRAEAYVGNELVADGELVVGS